MRKDLQGSLFDSEAVHETAPRCMGIGTGGVVCESRAARGSLYCRNCDPQKKMNELIAAYDRLWAELIPNPEDLQVGVAGSHHSELAAIWDTAQADAVREYPDRPGRDQMLRARVLYLDRAIDWASANRPVSWERIETFESDIADLREAIEADSMIEGLRISTEDLANPVYPPLPHEVKQPDLGESGTRVYTCHHRD